MGHAVAQLVEALRYKPEGSRFDSRWCHWNFSLTQSFRPHYVPGDDSDSNRNEYQEYFLGVKAASTYGWQLYYLHVLIVLKSGSLSLLEPSGSVQACNGIAFYKRNIYEFNVNKKVQLDATVCRHLFTAQSLYMFRVSQHPYSGVLKTLSATSGIGHITGIATSFQRGLIRTGASESCTRLAHTSPDQATLEGSRCTSIMTYTRGSR